MSKGEAGRDQSREVMTGSLIRQQVRIFFYQSLLLGNYSELFPHLCKESSDTCLDHITGFWYDLKEIMCFKKE